MAGGSYGRWPACPPSTSPLFCPFPTDEGDRYRRALLKDLLASFPKYLSAANLKVKALPAGNPSIVLAVLRRSHSGGTHGAGQGAIYVVDLTALCPDQAHRRLKESDPYFEDCDLQDCACLPMALEVGAVAGAAAGSSGCKCTLC